MKTKNLEYATFMIIYRTLKNIYPIYESNIN